MICAVVRFCYHSYDNRPYWTPLSPITSPCMISWIIYAYKHAWSIGGQMHYQHQFAFVLFIVNQIGFMLPWVCSVTDHNTDSTSDLSMNRNTATRNLFVNPLHPNISMHFPQTVLYTSPMVLRKRICLIIKSVFSWWSFPLFSWPQCLF